VIKYSLGLILTNDMELLHFFLNPPGITDIPFPTQERETTK